MTIGDALAEMARMRPTATAIEIGGETPVTYRALHEEAIEIGARLASAGLRPGQGVLVVTRARPRVPALIHGALLAGGVAVSIEPSTPPAQLRAYADRAHAAFALGDPDIMDWLSPKSSGPLTAGRPQDPHFARLADPAPIRPPLDAPDRVRAPADRPAMVIFTSGSTGQPKGVLLSHASLLAAARRMTEARAHRPSDRHLCYLSFSHLAELFMSVVLPTVAGYTVVTPRGRRLTEAIAAARPTFFMGVPAEWQTLSAAAVGQDLPAQDIRANLGLDRVRLAMSTGAPLAAEVYDKLFGLGLLIHEMYGMTETSGAVTYNAPGSSRSRSVGLALPGSRVALGDDGEVQLYGQPYRCLGYLDDEESTRSLFIDDDGVRTGDLGSLDEDGYLFVTGRKKDLLVLSTGKKVAPSGIEARLAAIPLVRHAAVFGEGHAHLVAVLDAVADPRLRTAPQTRAELHAHLKAHFFRINAELAKHERIVAIGVAPQPFSILSGELTPSLKVRRETVRIRHRALIEALLGKHSVPSGIGDILRFDDG
jgi:long-chain acyl-CoA synthetase